MRKAYKGLGEFVFVKVILARKGFDSEFGGSPSPILPDGSMVSLPIPAGEGYPKYSDIHRGPFNNLEELMQRCGIPVPSNCHSDPDIYRESQPRDQNWRALFGQHGTAEAHLEHQKVGVGDLFLFFGLYRRVDADYHFTGDEMHAIFGYMQIGQVIHCDETTKLEPWMEYHPHADLEHRRERNNTIYVAESSGVFKFDERLVLTKQGMTKSRWDPDKLPKDLKMSMHPNPYRNGYFQSSSPGQEFVMQNGEEWARALLRDCKTQ